MLRVFLNLYLVEYNLSDTESSVKLYLQKGFLIIIAAAYPLKEWRRIVIKMILGVQKLFIPSTLKKGFHHMISRLHSS